MPVQIGQPRAPSFAEPLALLSDCHRRIEHFLETMIVVTEQRAGGALPAQHREALDGALRYFREAAPKHTADEDESLFPRLRAAAPAAAQAEVAALQADHDRATAAHAVVDDIGAAWLRDDRLPAERVARLRAVLEELRAIYHRHIAVEDERVFPLAARVLDGAQLREIGREMARRRGHDPERVLTGPRG